MSHDPRITDEPWPPFAQRLMDGFMPAVLVFHGARFFILQLLQTPLLLTTDFQAFRHRAFAKLWDQYGDAMSEELPGASTKLIKDASGVVLDIGPGTGSLLRFLDKSKITMAYGPEPAIDMHPKLQQYINKAGLTDQYKILSAGAEAKTLIPALAKEGLIKTDGSTVDGIFDTILSTRVLCGVPNQAETAEQLYRLLKPGGHMIVCEHIRSPWPNAGSFTGWATQKFMLLCGWNLWLGGCEVNRDTVASLRKAAGETGWRKFDLQYVSPFHSVPFIVGTLEK
ncbi:S-adenosyl-L-methionine-dependent methyltransferase [Microthyrium microscopicum]|uniref:S-adenosyl-L-methionine-dependent methyltransferase n=1 Tax=Microthyrium microscopicum TaxID=703497 RepID=A0A6A6U9Z4_9PEZI|nr:S-adenosyl-L-methionine-dependent methyltransferase [Microthyrium microscopicum]